jgi:hypothetical protein
MLDIGVIKFTTKNTQILFQPPDLVIRYRYLGVFISRKKNATPNYNLGRISQIRLGDADANGDKSSVD